MSRGCPWPAITFGFHALPSPSVLTRLRASTGFAEIDSSRETPAPSPYDILASPPKTLVAFCRLVLLTSDPDSKVSLIRDLVTRFRNGELKTIGTASDLPPPDEPPRPASVVVVEPGKAQRIGRGGTVENRVKMMHALASIEQWACDLSLDVVCRFWDWRVGSEDGKTGKRLPMSFFADFLKVRTVLAKYSRRLLTRRLAYSSPQVAEDEAKHFTLLRARMKELGTEYGDLPVHHGLWESVCCLAAMLKVLALTSVLAGSRDGPLSLLAPGHHTPCARSARP